MKKCSILLVLIGTLFLFTPEVMADKARNILPTKINFTGEVPPDGHLILGVYEDRALGIYGDAIEKNSKGGLTHAIEATDFKAKIMSTQLITAPIGSGYKQILLVGLGQKEGTLTDIEWQDLGGNALQKAVEIFKTAPAIVLDVSPNIAANFVFGAKLGSYYFDKYYTDQERHKHQQQMTLVTQESKQADKYYYAELEPVANAIWLTRDMSNEPANVIYPESFVSQWTEHFKGLKNIKVRVLDENDMLKYNMGAIYGVGRGSKRPPRMMIVEYMGGKKGDAPVAIVGKGITFDTGGISIKGSNNMWHMKFDMSGAASTMGTLYALANRNAKVNAIGVAALAENMPGANAQRPGDVVTSMSGKTIQIRSTDAEGRLVLADGLYYADTTYNPALIVDLATLTGSVGRALGKDYAGLFTRDENLVDQFISVGKLTGEELWNLPLNENHFKAIENNVADVMNSGPDAPGASAGAAFLGSFVRESTPVSYTHLTLPTICSV